MNAISAYYDSKRENIRALRASYEAQYAALEVLSARRHAASGPDAMPSRAECALYKKVNRLREALEDAQGIVD